MAPFVLTAHTLCTFVWSPFLSEPIFSLYLSLILKQIMPKFLLNQSNVNTLKTFIFLPFFFLPNTYVTVCVHGFVYMPVTKISCDSLNKS